MRFMIVCGLALAGALHVSAAESATDSDWREGRVIALLSGTDAGKGSVLDCRRGMSADQLAHARFARIEFFSRHAWAHAEVPLRAGQQVTVGDRVEVDVRDCAESIRPLVPE